MRLRDIEIGCNFLIYRENMSKTFHGGIKDLKKTPKVIKHVCHKEGEEDHQRCLVKIYSKYYELTTSLDPSTLERAFYFQPNRSRYALNNNVMGTHKLNSILPNLCEAIGAPRKTAHSLRVICASSLFRNRVQEKLI